MNEKYTPDIPELRAAFLLSCHLNGVTDGAEDAFNRALADIRAAAWWEGYRASIATEVQVGTR